MNSSLRTNSIMVLPSAFMSVFGSIGVFSRNAGLKRYLIIPFILNMLLFGIIIYCAVVFLYPAIVSMLPQGTEFYMKLIRAFAKPFLIILIMLVSVFLYSVTGMVLCAPFVDIVSERVEQIVTGKNQTSSFSINEFIREIAMAIESGVLLLLFFIAFNIALVFLNFIPIAGNLLYAVISVLSFFFFIGFQMFDVVLSRKGMNFSQKLGVMWKIKWASVGIGAGFLIISYVPFVGFLSPILAVAGATQIYFSGTVR